MLLRAAQVRPPRRISGLKGRRNLSSCNDFNWQRRDFCPLSPLPPRAWGAPATAERTQANYCCRAWLWRMMECQMIVTVQSHGFSLTV